MHTYMHMFMCMCMCMYMCMCMCVHMYVHVGPEHSPNMHMHMHMCMYTHAHVHAHVTCAHVTCLHVHVGPRHRLDTASARSTRSTLQGSMGVARYTLLGGNQGDSVNSVFVYKSTRRPMHGRSSLA